MVDGKEGVMDGRVARPGIYDAVREMLGMGFLVWSGCGVVVVMGWGGGIGSKGERRRGGGIGLKGGRDEEDTVLLF